MSTSVLTREPSNGSIEIPKAISADSHTIEPPEAYAKHIDPAWRDRAPKIAPDPAKGAVYVIDGMPARIAVGSVSACGKRQRAAKDQNGDTAFFLDDLPPPFPEGRFAERDGEVAPVPMASLTFDDIPAGGWRVAPRLEAQDRDGIVAEVVYPTMGMVLCNHPDADYQNACFNAYNRWLQEFVSEAPTRLFGVGQTALRTVEEGIADLRRIKEMGLVGVLLPGAPPIEEDWHAPVFDPLWEAAQDLELPISFHTLASGRNRNDAPRLLMGQVSSVDFGLAMVRANQDVLSSFVLGGVFERFPRLKLVCVEAGAGWIPDYLYRMDHGFKRHGSRHGLMALPRLPSEYFNENVYVTFQDDPIAFALTGLLNPKRLLWANDYPHSDATWPWSRNLLAEHLKPVPEEQRVWILHDNVKELYNLPTP
ncbi:amidohydrolase [Novosphingobium sp. G106]|uniref:amidohydrolase family protein n=1 Tax=Novosphingobium sp. G106 TaxID=2849500 RepID=UPI001C2CE5A5|nr:amidohydrolase family protein [Novosphingobium sp. G106]MBV1689360.1 amidohydrolase [Novosphingobium sp. G106]